MTAIDTALPSLTLVKSFEYRGGPEEWSNTYFFTGDTPSSDADWKLLADDVAADEKTIHLAETTIVRAIGHEAGESVAVWGYDYAAFSEEIAGTYALAGTENECGGDTAAWIRWSTDQRTSKGKPIYLRSYFHPAINAGSTSTDRDVVAARWVALAQTYGDAWVTGYTVDGELRHRAGPHGVVGLTSSPSEWVTTRTLERRGKRPT